MAQLPWEEQQRAMPKTCNWSTLFNKYPLTLNKMGITSLLIFNAISTSCGLQYSNKLSMVAICPQSLHVLSTGFINDLSSDYLSLFNDTIPCIGH